MSALAKLLDGTLRRAGIPIDGVSIGFEGDRSTWVVRYAAGATKQDMAAGTALVTTFDPTSPAVLDAAKTEAAQAVISPTISAFYLWWFRKMNKRDPTPQERAADTADLIQAFKDAG